MKSVNAEKLARSPDAATQQWPADAVEKWDIERLIPNARNSMQHSEWNIASIAASIREWGWTVPVLVDEVGTLIAGHGRVLAAQKLGIKEVPVMTAAGWSDAKKRAYMIADNRLPSREWNEEMLAVELDELRDLKFDMSLMGFTPQELNDLIGTPNTGPLDTKPQLSDGFKFSVMIACANEIQQGEMLQRFEAEGLRCRPLITQ